MLTAFYMTRQVCYVFFGDYRKLLTAAEDYSRVTKADVQRVAEKYFSAKNRTVAILVPRNVRGFKFSDALRVN